MKDIWTFEAQPGLSEGVLIAWSDCRLPLNIVIGNMGSGWPAGAGFNEPFCGQGAIDLGQAGTAKAPLPDGWSKAVLRVQWFYGGGNMMGQPTVSIEKAKQTGGRSDTVSQHGPGKWVCDNLVFTPDEFNPQPLSNQVLITASLQTSILTRVELEVTM